MEALLTAILNNDVAAAKQLLKTNPLLATAQIEKPRLYQAKIFHWLYARDTALHLAAAGHRTELVKLLLAQGADPNAAHNHRSGAPLHYAADGCVGDPEYNSKQQLQTLRALLDAGAKVNMQDKNGATPLHRAVRTRSSDAVKYLLESGADPNLKNKPGSTPFHLAVQNTGRGGSGSDAAHIAQVKIIQHFLAAGCDPLQRSASGKSVIDTATSASLRELLAR